MKKLFILSLILLLPLALFAQRGTIVGKVTDSDNGDELVGANVLIKGTSIGAASGMNGTYKIAKVPPGSYTLRTTFMGYKMAEKDVQVTAGQEVKVDIELDEDVIYGEAIGIIADRAKERETPVAFTNITKQEFVQRLGSRDIPLVLNTTPSVYATQGGGGAGDARVNVRGFNQRNVAIMINGVPVNDMENGWVYWSNWDGVADATSSIQMQRGLSAVNLATPSIGGTMNILTDPTAMEAGVKFRQEVGNDGFLKTTLSASSGLINDKFAFNGAIVRKTGDGLIDATWTDAWAYYFGASYNINANNRLELYALGAPQRHGQNLYMQNIGAYSHSFAKDLDGYDEAALYNPATGDGKFKEEGRLFNQNWAPVKSSYTGKQSWNEGTNDRYDSGLLNERENFFHKPQVNLNWFTKLNDDLSVYTVAYYSGGHGGGTGSYGSIYTRDALGELGDDNYKCYYGPSPWYRDWDATIAMNQGPAGDYYIDKKKKTKVDGQSIGILRNSRNNQWTIGAISKANYKVSDKVKATIGIDWRTAEIEHYREVRDLLGGEFYIDNSSDFWGPDGKKVGLGDKIAYNFTNTVNWLGFFGQTEYKSARLTAVGMGGYSMIKYNHTNHFLDDGTGNEIVRESDQITGLQVKGGASYRITSSLNVYGNAGYVSKVPIFDAVINDQTGDFVDNEGNEDFISLEAGVATQLLDGQLNLKGNFYYTTWENRTLTQSDYDIISDDEGIIVITGMDAKHSGFEIEAAYQPINMLRFDAAASIGNWENTSDANALYKDYGGEPDTSFTIYVKDLKTGDAPQTQFALAASVLPINGLMLQAVFKHYTNHYAAWNAITRTDATDRAQSWKAPNYSVLDFHASYNLPLEFAGIKPQLFAHVFNVLDAEFIQDAVDNSQYNGYTSNGTNHSADDAEVYFGLPRMFNVGLSLHY
jgi:iron complex outermembrane recepter protein